MPQDVLLVVELLGNSSRFGPDARIGTYYKFVYGKGALNTPEVYYLYVLYVAYYTTYSYWSTLLNKPSGVSLHRTITNTLKWVGSKVGQYEYVW
eukprot:6036747-Pyramimonas_sp.AAC.1